MTLKLYVVLEERPVRVCECDVTRVESCVVWEPYDVVIPYCTCEVDASFVVHVISACVVVMEEEATLDITGAVVSSGAPESMLNDIV